VVVNDASIAAAGQHRNLNNPVFVMHYSLPAMDV
jgi:hypothetical protein